jgi:LPXTG-site transpeptidase (sortase) family protein
MGIKAKAGILLMISGILIISRAVYVRWDTNRKQQVMIEEFNKTVGDEDAQGNSTQPDYNPDVTTVLNPTDVNGMIGILSIPKINLKVAVVNGVDAVSLKIALGHFKETCMPGERGNCAISGHRSFTYNQFFNRLDEIGVGDEVDVSTKSGNFKYVVYEKKIVDPHDVSVLNKTDEPVLTLITCHPPRSSAYRLIIRGKLAG